jgi:methyltransferase
LLYLKFTIVYSGTVVSA